MTAITTTHHGPSTDFITYLQKLTADEATPLPESETWEATLARMSDPSHPAEIDEKTFSYFLGVLPPRFMLGEYFGFAEGAEPVRLFWERGDRYFVRLLDWTQTKILCQLRKCSIFGE